MRIDVVTIFPGYLAPLHESLIGKAIADGIIDLAVHDLRTWTTDPHHSVDDTPYGGGPGMVMRPDVWGRALDAVVAGRALTGTPGPAFMDPAVTGTPGPALTDPTVTGTSAPVLVIPTPAGEPFTQAVARELCAADHLVFACGRYEGIDDRVARDAARSMTVRELSIGDYVLAGGEAAVLVMVEAIGRLLPGVLGNVESAADDSFGDGSGDGPAGLLESPVYTRPADYRGLDVPPVLLSGNHAAIRRWRRDESLRRTAAHRPDLLAALTADDLDARDLEVLVELGLTPPDGLAERVAAERAAREAKRRRRRQPRSES
jgi:tRNA (guanine37-N1)-methyltransferase